MTEATAFAAAIRADAPGRTEHTEHTEHTAQSEHTVQPHTRTDTEFTRTIRESGPGRG